MKRVLSILMAVFLVLVMPVTAGANAAEPPAVTILVMDAPEDLTLTLTFPEDANWPNGEKETPIVLKRSSRGNETYYRFYYGQMKTGCFYDSVNYLDRVTITAATGGKETVCPLPERPKDEDGHSLYNVLLTLNLEKGALSWSNTTGRDALLIALRVGLTILIEGLVFFACGYRARRSWLIFLLTNLVTQGLLNLALSSAPTGLGAAMVSALLVYCGGEFLIFATEMLAFGLLLKEKSPSDGVVCALLANLASLLLGGALLLFLPL